MNYDPHAQKMTRAVQVQDATEVQGLCRYGEGAAMAEGLESALPNFHGEMRLGRCLVLSEADMGIIMHICRWQEE